MSFNQGETSNVKVGIATLVVVGLAGAWAPAAWANIHATPNGGAVASASAGGAVSVPEPDVAPAGIADYSYIEIRYLDVGSSDYFGDSSKGNGAKFSFQFTDHAFVYGSYDRLAFDNLGGHLYRTGVGLGYQQTEGRISAYVRIGYYREMLSASLGGARDYYFEPAYGMRAAFGENFYLEGELYTDLNVDFGSRPWGVKFGVAGVFGPVSLHLVADHNRDVNSVQAALRFAF